MILKTFLYAIIVTSTFVKSVLANEQLYVPTVHILTTDGEFKSYVLAGFKEGVSRMECEMRLEAWDKRYNFSETTEQLKAQGENVLSRLKCEPK